MGEIKNLQFNTLINQLNNYHDIFISKIFKNNLHTLYFYIPEIFDEKEYVIIANYHLKNNNLWLRVLNIDVVIDKKYNMYSIFDVWDWPVNKWKLYITFEDLVLDNLETFKNELTHKRFAKSAKNIS